MSDSHAMAASLRGLALGDGFGERWFFRGNGEAIAMIGERRIPDEDRWYWTDDTAMALALAWVLWTRGRIEQQELAEVFADGYERDPARGYGFGMHQLLPQLRGDPGNWATYARSLFGGQGSLGNGAAMRVAPLGAFFHADLERAVEHARRSAEVTHAHPEAVAGAIAVAVAAALAAGAACSGGDFLTATAEHTPAGAIRDGLLRAAGVEASTPAWKASDILGNGQRVRASDTVPFAVWSAAHHLDSLTEALWTTAEGLGDVDTTCAITGGVVAARTGLDGVPAAWTDLAEELPVWVGTL